MADVFKSVLDISLAGSALALLALAARLIIGRRPNAALPLLSALVILRLAMPVTIPSPLSVMNLFQDIRAEQPASKASGDVNETAGNEFTPSAVSTGADITENTTAENHIQENPINLGTNVIESNAAAERPATKPFPVIEIASIIWIVGMAAMAACIAVSNIRFSLTLKKNRRYDLRGFGELLDSCKTELNIKGRIEAVQLSGINTAAVYGILRPKLLISPSFGWLSEEEKRHVLLHELSHIKRRDTLVCLLITMLNAVYWFNPVIWIAFALARRDLEMMCDMAALKLIRDRKGYASTLFSIAKASGDSKPKLITALFIKGPQNALRFGVLISTDSIKRRMKMITRYKRSRLFTAVSLILVFAIAVTGCTGAISAATENEEKLIAAFSLDISVLPEDAARMANIEKAAKMSDGFVFPAVDKTKKDPELRSTWVESNLELTESGGWRSAPALDQEVIDKAFKWTMIYDPKTGITTNKDLDKFNSEVFGVKTANKVGGGAELVMLVVQKAISVAGMDHSDGVSFDSLGFGGMNNYEENLTLRVRVQDNKITAAFYESAGTAANYSLPRIEGQELIGSYSLDFSSIAGDEARVANIKKAAEMLDGTVFPQMGVALTVPGRQIDIPDVLRPITEVAGWRNAAWTGWGSVDVCIHESDETSGYYATAQDSAAETRMQVGGGIEIAAAAYYRAALLAKLDCGGTYAKYPEEDNVDKGGVGAVNNFYASDLILRMWVENNCVIAAFYAPAETAASSTIPDIEGQELIGSYSLDFSSIAVDEARVANIKKAAEIIDGTVLPAADETQTDPDQKYKRVAIDLGVITESGGWRTAPAIGLEIIEKAAKWTMIHNSETGINTDKDPDKFNNEIFGSKTANKTGGGAEIVMLAVYKAINATGGIDNNFDTNIGFTKSLSVIAANVKFPKSRIKVWVQDNKIVAALYSIGKETQIQAAVSPALTDQKLISRFIVDYSAFANDAARVANIEKGAVLLDGTMFPHWDASLSEQDDYKRQINLMDKLNTITPDNGWQKAPWLGWDNMRDIMAWADGDIYVADSYFNTTDLAGGGIDLVIIAAYAGGISANMSEIMDWGNAKEIKSGGAGIANDYYDKDVTLKVRTEDNKIIAEFYVPEGAEKVNIIPAPWSHA